MGPDGPLRELDDEGVRAVVDAVAEANAEAVAVCLLHAYRHPQHERALGEALAGRLPGVHVSLSHEAVGTFREFERAATTELDAALSPLLRSYLRRLVERAGEAGLPEPAVMQSSGGLASAGHAGAHAALTVLSGPAGGAAGAAWAARAAGEPDALCFDMGGTSCDVCVILGGEVREAAGREVGELAGSLGLEPLECAEGIRRVANAEMVRALRVMTVERGVDPRELSLLCFGGAGGLHAADIAEELGMTRILCPRASGVLAALGLVVSERRRDAQRSVLLSGSALTAAALRGEIAALAARAGAGELRVRAELRYRGQAFELAVDAEPEPDPDALRERFAAAHERAYGYRDEEGDIELVTLRVTATQPSPDVDAAAAGAHGRGAERSTRTAHFDGEPHEAEVLTGEPEPGTELAGPAICELPEATLAVPPGWHGRVDA